MNLLQIQDALKGFSDEQLAGEMTQPSGQTPQYMVMTEMQRRKDMRDEYAAQPQPGTSIADEMTQEATMGLGSLQGASQPQQGYAYGGLVDSYA